MQSKKRDEIFAGINVFTGCPGPYGAFLYCLIDHGPVQPVFYHNGMQTAIGQFAWLYVLLSRVVLPVIVTCLVGFFTGVKVVFTLAGEAVCYANSQA